MQTHECVENLLTILKQASPRKAYPRGCDFFCPFDRIASTQTPLAMRFFTTVSSLKIYQAELKEFNLEIDKTSKCLGTFWRNCYELMRTIRSYETKSLKAVKLFGVV